MTEFNLGFPSSTPRIALIAGQFNRFVSDELIQGAMDALRRHGLDENTVPLYWVPGAFELPLAADRILSSGRADAVLALGAVIRGGTAHFEYVAGECARGISNVALKHGKPVIFGVLTTDTIEQAMERAAVNEGNKGFDCAMAALHMLGLIEKLEEQ
jgi:6,7-dimethyl-8-ribityllumazine synthase